MPLLSADTLIAIVTFHGMPRRLSFIGLPVINIIASAITLSFSFRHTIPRSLCRLPRFHALFTLGRRCYGRLRWSLASWKRKYLRHLRRCSGHYWLGFTNILPRICYAHLYMMKSSRLALYIIIHFTIWVISHTRYTIITISSSAHIYYTLHNIATLQVTPCHYQHINISIYYCCSLLSLRHTIASYLFVMPLLIFVGI